eukprot:TRINITY_DN1686_c1_g1_i1.p1 TRINITY_DN1686_c1_g1~~TRINITY_DN1686_c1_g1_i1.p1  ORF type:complete len:617 (+),score=73.43 TRINITY_DN1686_c1_g1_i1:45-1853(+)
MAPQQRAWYPSHISSLLPLQIRSLHLLVVCRYKSVKNMGFELEDTDNEILDLEGLPVLALGDDEENLKLWQSVAKRGVKNTVSIGSAEISKMTRISRDQHSWISDKIGQAAPRCTDKKSFAYLGWEHQNLQKLDLTKTEERKVDKSGIRAMCRLGMFPSLSVVELSDMPGNGLQDILRELKPVKGPRVCVHIHKQVKARSGGLEQLLQMAVSMKQYWTGIHISSIYVRKQEDFSDMMSRLVEVNRSDTKVSTDLVLDFAGSGAREAKLTADIINFVKSKEMLTGAVLLTKCMVSSRAKVFPLQECGKSWLKALGAVYGVQKAPYTGNCYYDHTSGKWWHARRSQSAVTPFSLCWQSHINMDCLVDSDCVDKLEEELAILHKYAKKSVSQMKVQLSGSTIQPEALYLRRIIMPFTDVSALKVLHLSINSPQVFDALLKEGETSCLGQLSQLQRLAISLNVVDKETKKEGVLEEFFLTFLKGLRSLSSLALYGILGGDDYVFFEVGVFADLRVLKSLELQVENLLVDYAEVIGMAKEMTQLTRIELEVGFDFESVPEDVLQDIRSNHLEDLEDDLLELLPSLRCANVFIEESAYDDLITYSAQY